jgi:hypothetical protein
MADQARGISSRPVQRPVRREDLAEPGAEPLGESERVAPGDDRESRRSVTLAELVALAAATVVGLVALVSLAAAHLHHHTPLVVAAGSLVLIAAVVALVVVFDRPVLRVDFHGLLAVLVGAAFTAIMVFPGFEYATGDRDPGAYVEHAVAISRTHSIDFTDDLVVAKLPGGVSPGAEWPAMWDEPGHPGKIFPQFYHLWPALLATAKDAGGFTGLFDTGPLLAVVAVGLAVAVARRLAGLPAAWAVALLLSTNMLEVWQAKYPTAEIFGQMLFVGSLLAVVLAIQTGWRSAAALGGVLLSLSYLERADGIVLVLFGWGALCVLLAARRFDQRAAWFAAGLIVLLPYGFYQAYDLASHYTLANNVPSFAKVLAVMIAAAVVGALLAWQRRLVAAVIGWAAPARRRFLLGTAFVVLCGGLMLLGGLRPKLFGKDYFYIHGARGRSFDEISLIRLSWFFSLPGLALMLVGFGYVGWRRWHLDRWLVAIPTVFLLTLYCYHLHNSPYLMWATRRFVTSVVPGMVLIMGFGVTLLFIVLRRYLPRLVGAGLVAALVIGLTVFYLSESWPLRSHNENGGSVEVENAIAAVSGSQRGVFLWQRSNYCCDAPYQLFGGPLFTISNQSSALLPPPSGLEKSVITKYVDYFKPTGRPVFYVADGTHKPPAVAGVSSAKVLELQGSLPHWEETYTSRPKKRHDYPYHVTVYRLAPV